MSFIVGETYQDKLGRSVKIISIATNSGLFLCRRVSNATSFTYHVNRESGKASHGISGYDLQPHTQTDYGLEVE